MMSGIILTFILQQKLVIVIILSSDHDPDFHHVAEGRVHHTVFGAGGTDGFTGLLGVFFDDCIDST